MILYRLRNGFLKFISEPRYLFWFYIIINLVPSILLAFTEPLDPAGKIILILFSLGLYMFLYSLVKNNGMLQVLLIPLLFIHAFQIVLLYLFGEGVIAVDMFLNVVTTNSSEAGEVLQSILPSVIFVCVLYIPAICIAIRQWYKKRYLSSNFRRKTVRIGALLIVLAILLSFFAKEKNTNTYSFKEHLYPANVFYNLGFAINKWHKSSQYPITSAGFSFQATRDTILTQREIYVMVIGETGRADNWSLYGYDRQTNPLLSKKDGVVVFKDALTQSNTTHKSVSIMLSEASAEDYDIIYTQKGILTAFKEAGFTTAFLSNQSDNHVFTAFFSEEADIKKSIRVADKGGFTPNLYDGALLPLLKEVIDSTNNNLFIILHTYGSHFNYKERYPEDFAYFQPDNVNKSDKKDRDIIVNAYDNSILYTDFFLAQTINLLEQTNACSALLYSSDHGEDIFDDDRYRFLHASPHPTIYQLKIAMFMWFSKPYIQTFTDRYNAALNNQDKPVSTNSIFHTLLDMSHIQTPYKHDDLSLVNSNFKNRERMYLDDHDNPIPYYKANLKKQDLEIIEKRGIYK